MRPFAATRVTPNHVTTLRLATGLAAAAAFAVGGAAASYVGAALFLLSLFLDRADGELARLTGQASAWGHRYDLVADAISNAAVFIGIGVGARGMLGPLAIGLGAFAGLGVIAILAVVMRVEARRGAHAAEFRRAGGFDIEDTLLIVPLAMVSDLGWMFIVAAGTGVPLFALAMMWRHRQSLGKA